MKVQDLMDSFAGVDEAELIALKNDLEGRPATVRHSTAKDGSKVIHVRGHAVAGQPQRAAFQIPDWAKELLLKLLLEYLGKKKKAPTHENGGSEGE